MPEHVIDSSAQNDSFSWFLEIMLTFTTNEMQEVIRKSAGISSIRRFGDVAVPHFEHFGSRNLQVAFLPRAGKPGFAG